MKTTLWIMAGILAMGFDASAGTVVSTLADVAYVNINYPKADGSFLQAASGSYPASGPASAAISPGTVTGTITNYEGSGNTLSYSADGSSSANGTTLGTYAHLSATWSGTSSKSAYLDVTSTANFYVNDVVITGGSGQGHMALTLQLTGSVTTSGGTFATRPGNVSAFARLIEDGSYNQYFTSGTTTTDFISFTFGTPFQLVESLGSEAHLDIIQPGTQSATVDFAHTLTPVSALITDANGNAVAGAVINSGFVPLDAQNASPTPEPGSGWLLVGCGCAAWLVTVKNRKCKRNSEGCANA